MKKNNTFFLVLILLLCKIGIAQVTTVIPLDSYSVVSPTSSNSSGDLWVDNPGADPSRRTYSKLTFDLSSLPKDAEIIACTLRLVVAKFDSDRIKVTVNDITGNKDNQIASSATLLKNDYPDEVYRENEGAVLISSRDPARFAQSLTNVGTSNKLVLKLLTTSGERPAISFCSGPKKTDDITQEGLVPRLIVTYSFKPRPVEWAGLQADAQHSSRSNQRFYGSRATGWAVMEISDLKDINYEPVAYNGQIFLAAGPAQSSHIYAIDPMTKGESSVGPKPGTNGLKPPAKMPVIDPFGKLYYFDKDRMVQCYDLEKKDNSTSFRLPFDLKATPTAGPDGRLYVSTANYIFGYSPYPQHKPIWRFSVGAATPGSVALNKEGSIAYVVLVEGNEKRIVALNTIDGSEINQQIINIPTPQGSVPMPAVDANGNVFVVDKFPTGNSIYVLDGQLKEIIYTIKGNNVTKPAIDLDGNVYYVKDSRLYSYKNKTEKPLGSRTDLGTISSMVMDESKNIYCLNIDKKSVYVFNSNSLDQGYLSDVRINNFKGDMLLATDGSIYAVGSNSLFAIRPTTFAPSANTFPDNDFNRYTQNATFRAATLTVGTGTPFNYPKGYEQTFLGSDTVSMAPNVTLEKGSTLTVISGNKISFKPGFTVKSGAKLTCKIIDLENLGQTTEPLQDELFDLNVTYYITDAKHNGSLRSSPGGGVYHNNLHYNSPGIVFNWYFMPTGDGYYYIYDLQYNRALIAPEYYDYNIGTSSIYPGAPEGKEIAQWKITPSGIAGKYIITNRKHNVSLVAGDVADNFIYLQAHNNRQNAYWTFTATKEKAPANKPNPNAIKK